MLDTGPVWQVVVSLASVVIFCTQRHIQVYDYFFFAVNKREERIKENSVQIRRVDIDSRLVVPDRHVQYLI